MPLKPRFRGLGSHPPFMIKAYVISFAFLFTSWTVWIIVIIIVIRPPENTRELMSRPKYY